IPAPPWRGRGCHVARVRSGQGADYAASAHARLCAARRREPHAVPANQDLVTLIRAHTPLIVIESTEEARVVDGFRHAIAQALRPLFRWTITGGLERLDLDLRDDDD